MNQYIVLDGFKYAVVADTYIRSWDRSYTSELAGNLIRINYVDRGPGLLTYSFSLQLNTWPPDSPLYTAGITQTAEEQMSNLEASYEKIATSLNFTDPLGNPPDFNTGVFFGDLKQIIPNYSTNQKLYFLVQVKLIEAAGIVI